MSEGALDCNGGNGNSSHGNWNENTFLSYAFAATPAGVNQIWHERILAETSISNIVDRVGFEATTIIAYRTIALPLSYRSHDSQKRLVKISE